MRFRRNPWVLLILLFAGSLAGGILGELLSQYPFFSWMALGGQNGYQQLFSINLDPLFDIRLLRFGLDLTMRVNVGSLIGMTFGFLAFLRFG